MNNKNAKSSEIKEASMTEEKPFVKKDGGSPQLFKYLNYRNFLKDTVEYLRSRQEYSNKKFAQKAGFGSPAFLRMVINGERNLTIKSLRKISRALGLGKTETQFFELLVLFSQTDQLSEKEEYYNEILKFTKFKETRKVCEKEFKYFSNWYTSVILEAVGTEWGEKSVEEMAQSLKLSLAEVKSTLNLLEDLTLIHKRGGRWFRKESSLESSAETGSMNTRRLHREMCKKAVDSLDHDPKEERGNTSMTIALTAEQFEKLKKTMFEMTAEMSAEFSLSKNAKSVYQFNMQLFPVLSLKS